MGKLTLQQLESKLWECLDVLRGELSATQYMDYMFGMLFLKRFMMNLSSEYLESEDILGDAYSKY